jgi:hypothetical protein
VTTCNRGVKIVQTEEMMGIINIKDNRNSRDSVLSSSYQGLQNTVKQDGYISQRSLSTAEERWCPKISCTTS